MWKTLIVLLYSDFVGSFCRRTVWSLTVSGFFWEKMRNRKWWIARSFGDEEMLMSLG